MQEEVQALAADLFNGIAYLVPLLIVIPAVFLGSKWVFTLFRETSSYTPSVSEHYRKPDPVSPTPEQRALASVESEHLKVIDKRSCKCAYCLGDVKPVTLTPPTVEDWAGWEHYGLLKGGR